ncbi:MAG TPA: hypothetical protein PKE04_09575 [Clostridia bacterium]|nr:hypothetical protein [Clostridia bacterium]
MRIRKTREEKVIAAVVYSALFLFALSTLYPFINILAKAFSSYEANITGRVFMLPQGFQVRTMLNQQKPVLEGLLGFHARCVPRNRAFAAGNEPGCLRAFTPAPARQNILYRVLRIYDDVLRRHGAHVHPHAFAQTAQQAGRAHPAGRGQRVQHARA